MSLSGARFGVLGLTATEVGEAGGGGGMGGGAGSGGGGGRGGVTDTGALTTKPLATAGRLVASALVRASEESAAPRSLDDASWPVTTTVDVAEREVTDAEVTLTP